jgi:positive regulator of sigma E activity
MKHNVTKKRLRFLKIIQYVVALLWLISISIMLYQLIKGQPDIPIIISTMLFAVSFIIISKYHAHQSKKLKGKDQKN